MKAEVEMIRPDGPVRFLLYTDLNRRRATQLGPDIWMDMESIYGDRYALGAKLEICFLELSNKPTSYVVAMLPFIKQVPHPERPGETVMMRVVYLATAGLINLFEPVDAQSLTTAMLPN